MKLYEEMNLKANDITNKDKQRLRRLQKKAELETGRISPESVQEFKQSRIKIQNMTDTVVNELR